MPVINTNSTANSALHYLANNQAAQSSSVSKIASGNRITNASDDAAGLAVATKLTSDLTVLSQAKTNANNASAILQQADGTMSNIADMLQRMRSLATESLSGTVTDTQRAYLNAEYTQLATEIDQISSGTRFNDQSLMDGTNNWSNGTGIGVRIGTNSTDIITVKVANTTTSSLGVTYSSGTTGLNVASSVAAASALSALNTAVATLSGDRSSVGAQISRFNYRAETLTTSIQNIQSARSNITDTDVATEQTNLATEKVKTQAAIAVLSQANSMPSDLLSLLR